MDEATEEIQNECSPQEKESGTLNSVFDFIKFAIIAAAIVIPIRLYVAQPFVVSGGSMLPAFESGDYLIIDEISYRWRDPDRGETIVFRFPGDPKKFLIKRIAALPGETISIKDNEIIIKSGEEGPGFVWDQGEIRNTRGAEQTMTLGENEYFVLGDNRDESADSRLWGALNKKYIVGRPILRLFPFDKIDSIPGRWISYSGTGESR